MRHLLALATVVAVAAVVPAASARLASPVTCDQTLEPARWTDAGAPDQGRPDPVIAVHRGAAELAPENTMDAYRYAIAYDVEQIEVDVQQTLDHRYVSFHDMDVDAKTDGSGPIALMTYDQTQQLNAADNTKWKGSEYDPARLPSLEEILELADATDTGIMFDLKESVTDAATVANMAAAYPGMLERSVFIPYVPVRAEMILAAQPTARMIHSNQIEGEAPGFYVAAAQEFEWFGSSLPSYSPEKIAEIHDACSFVQPNVYQGHVTGSEAGDLAYALSIGADGAQVNTPEIATDVLDRPVATRFDDSCLVDARHGFGLPKKTVTVDGVPFTTAKGGCVDALAAAELAFAGDGSALPTQETP